MTIAVIGHGYVGLVSAAVFADLGNTVWIVGRTKSKIDKLKKGITLFYEPGLRELVKRNIDAGRIIFTLDYEEAVRPSSIIFICVGTPSKKTGDADLSAVYEASKKIGENITGYKVVVTKSTVPPGTNNKVTEVIKKVIPDGGSFAIASVPEFLREGSAISDTRFPDRIVIGTTSERARSMLADLHKPINGKFVFCNVETAELIKYASNSLLSTKISFANAVALLSEKVGADAEKVLEGVGLDKRIGRSFLFPGVGYGGSCFPKDVKALIALSAQHEYDFGLLREVEQINAQARNNFVQKILRHFKNYPGTKKIAILGLSFKPDTDDMRDAPSIFIIEKLIEAGFKITAYDPVAVDNGRLLLPGDVKFTANAYSAAKDADAVAVLTEWSEFKQIDLVKLAKNMKQMVLFDGRNIYDPETVKKLGFTYYGVGRI